MKFKSALAIVLALMLTLTGFDCGSSGGKHEAPSGGKHAAPGGQAPPPLQSWVPCHAWEAGVQILIHGELMTCRQLLSGNWAWVPW